MDANNESLEESKGERPMPWHWPCREQWQIERAASYPEKKSSARTIQKEDPEANQALSGPWWWGEIGWYYSKALVLYQERKYHGEEENATWYMQGRWSCLMNEVQVK